MASKTEERAVKIIMDGSQVGTTLKDLGKDIRAVTAYLNGLTPGTKEFVDASKRLAQVKQSYHEIKSEISQVGQSTNLLKTEFGKLTASFTASSLIQQGFSMIKDFFTGGVAEFMEAEQVSARLGQTIKSTGGAAGLTKTELEGMAGALQDVTTFEDDQIASGEALLLTFTKIGKDVFPGATEAMLNLSEALGQDVQSSAIQVGKALNDPITGLTALRRVGVSFSEEQKTLIKRFQESGDIASAQKIILQELQTEFGGVARAAAATGSGALKQLGVWWDNQKEKVGQVIVGLAAWALQTKSSADEAMENAKGVQEQTKSFHDLESKVTPLISRYEELKGKTNLSKGEQKELKDVIEQIGGVLPTAITNFDKYGHAIDVSAAAARQALEDQKKLMESKNRDAIAALKSQIVGLEAQLSANRKFLQQGTVEEVNMNTGIAKVRKATATDIKRWQNDLDENFEGSTARRLAGMKLQLDELKGTKKEEVKVIEDTEDVKTDAEIKAEKTKLRKSQDLILEAEEINISIIKDQHERESKMLDFKLKKEKMMLDRQVEDGEIDVAASNAKKLALNAEYEKGVTDLLEKGLQERDKQMQQMADDRQKEQAAFLEELEDRDKAMQDAADQRRADQEKEVEQYKAGIQLKIDASKIGSQARLDAEMEMLAFQMEQELTNTLLTEEQKQMIRDKYREELKQKDEEYWNEWGERVAGKISEVGDFTSELINANETIRKNKEEVELRDAKNIADAKTAEMKKYYDAENEKLDEQRENKVISDKVYKTKKEALDKEYKEKQAAVDTAYDAKQKQIQYDQAVRDKKIKTFEAIIAAAVGVAKAIPNVPLMILAGILGAAQVAVVQSTPLPELAEGGYAVTGRSGRKYSATYRGDSYGYVDSPSLFIAGEAGREYVVPGAMMADPAVANTVGWLESRRVSRSGRVREFADGGSVSSTRPAIPLPAQPDNTALMDTLERMNATLIQVQDRLANPPPARATISYDHIKRTDSEVQTAQQNSTLS